MGANDFHSYNINQTGGKGTFQLSKTTGTFQGIVTLSGSNNGFINVYDAANGLPLAVQPDGTGKERVLASGVTCTSALPHDDITAEVQYGIYVEAFGPVNIIARWT